MIGHASSAGRAGMSDVLDLNWTRCPNPIHLQAKRYHRFHFLSVGREGPTDVVRCCGCGIVVPRILEAPPGEKRHHRRGAPKPGRPWRGAGLGDVWDRRRPPSQRMRQLASVAEQIQEAERGGMSDE